MLLIMGISFYTTRVVLSYLGVNDYGIYNVVGGVVSMFAVVSSALTGAISRFLTFEIGKGDQRVINETFSAAVTILILVSVVFLVIMETVGVWFLNSKMNIAAERLSAANWVLQCSIITFIINLISIPYNALIIAYERMQAFAYISLLEAFEKLAVAFIISMPLFDSLKVYAVLLSLVALITRLTYGSYVARNFKELKVNLELNIKKFKDFLTFTGWTAIGGSANILNSQGVNILLNIFWGTAVNAARGVAVQVNSAITSFSGNFMMSVNPQIIKSYAQEEFERTEFLVFQSARFASYLMLILSIPVIIETQPILIFWLKDVPQETIIFIRIVLIQGIVDSMCLSLQTLNQASGKVKIYQIVAGGILLINFPLSYLFLRLGFFPQCVYYVALGVSVAGVFGRIFSLKYLIDFDIKKFLTSVFLRGLLVLAISISLPFIIIYFQETHQEFSLIAMGNILGSFLWAILVVYLIGLSSHERKWLNGKIQQFISKI